MRRDGPSDKTLLRRARQGDRQSFMVVLHRYDPRLRRLTLRLLADPKRVDRVLSRAYLKAWRSLPFLKRSEAAAGWLYRVVYNACLNELRWEPSRAAPPPPDGPPVPLPAAPVQRRLAALRALPPAERIPLVLVDGEGFSLDATARMMRQEPADIAADLARARSRWRAFVTGESEPLPEPEPAQSAEASSRIEATMIAPSPAATLAKLAALAAPTAPHEPGGHVRLLPPSPGGSTPPPVAAKRPPLQRRFPPETEVEAPAGPTPTAAEPSRSLAQSPPSRSLAQSPPSKSPAARRPKPAARSDAATPSVAGGAPAGSKRPGSPKRSPGKRGRPPGRGVRPGPSPSTRAQPSASAPAPGPDAPNARTGTPAPATDGDAAEPSAVDPAAEPAERASAPGADGEVPEAGADGVAEAERRSERPRSGKPAPGTAGMDGDGAGDGGEAPVDRDAEGRGLEPPADPLEPPTPAGEADGNGLVRPEHGPPVPGASPGPRRKRRRDSKRTVRTRARGGGPATGAAKPSRDDTDPGGTPGPPA